MMKIQIELDDSLLRTAVENQVGTAIAAFAGPVLDRMASEVIAKKLDRFSAEAVATRQVEAQTKKAVEEALEHQFGSGWSRTQKLREMLEKTLRELVKEAMK